MSINNTKTTKVERFRSTFVVSGGALVGGALVSSAPTEQGLHQLSKMCTNRTECAPTNWYFTWLVHLRQVHPLQACSRRTRPYSFRLALS